MENTQYTPEGPQGNSGNGATGLVTKAEEKVRELRETARLQAEQRVHQLGEKAQLRIEDQRDKVATRIEEAAARLRKRAETGGPVGVAGEKVAVRMEAAAGYMHQHQTREMADDLAAQVRKHPLRSIAIAAVIGYLLGRLLS